MSEIEIRVVAQTRFVGFHKWPDAPAEVSFLKNFHRHEFHVRAEKVVSHEYRDVEFTLLKRSLEQTIHSKNIEDRVSVWSCETWARHLLEELDLDKVEVFEDGENGAIVSRK